MIWRCVRSADFSTARRRNSCAAELIGQLTLGDKRDALRFHCLDIRFWFSSWPLANRSIHIQLYSLLTVIPRNLLAEPEPQGKRCHGSIHVQKEVCQRRGKICFATEPSRSA